MAKNPFQARDRQHFPAYSPSIFKAPKTPSSTEKSGSFRWSIDHLAVLHPADINIRDMQQDISPSSNDVEGQRSVERFFSQKTIVPSPWTQDKVPTKHVTFSPHPPDTAYIREESFNDSCNGKMVDASCQTLVTIPLNWDLEAMLGPDCVYYNDEERRIKDCGNTSLRRKLFGQPQRLSPNEDEATASLPCERTSPTIEDIKSPPITILATSPSLSDNLVATPDIIFTTSPSPSPTHHRSSFPVDHSPYYCVSPITAPADSQSHPEVDSKGILSPKLSPIKAKSVVTPDGLTTPNVHPSSGKSTSTPVVKRIQPMAAGEDNSRSDSSQSDSCTDSNSDHTPELLSLEDLHTNTYELTSVDMAMPSLVTSDHDNPTVAMEVTEGQVTDTTAITTTTKAVTTSTISHGAGVKSVSDSGIAGSSVEISAQLRDDWSSNLQGSCNGASNQLNIRKFDDKSSAVLSHTNSDHRTINSGEHYKEMHHPSAADSGLGYNLKTIGHAHSTDEVVLQGHLPSSSESITVSRSDPTVDSTETMSNLRTGFGGAFLPSKYQPPVEESTPKSRYSVPTSNSNDKNRWAWLPCYTSTKGDSFSSFAEGVLLRKEMLKSQLQFGPISSLCDCSNISSSATTQHSFSRHNSLEYSSSYPPTPLSSRTTGSATATAVRYRSPLSDKPFIKDHGRMNRLHLGSFRSRFNRFTLDNSSATPVSTIPAGRLSPTHHATAGRHIHSGRLWSSENSSERYNDWKRSMDRWENAIRMQYATVDS